MLHTYTHTYIYIYIYIYASPPPGPTFSDLSLSYGSCRTLLKWDPLDIMDRAVKRAQAAAPACFTQARRDNGQWTILAGGKSQKKLIGTSKITYDQKNRVFSVGILIDKEFSGKNSIENYYFAWVCPKMICVLFLFISRLFRTNLIFQICP